MPGFTSVDAAPRTLTSIELIHMRKKKQRRVAARDEGRTAAGQSSALAAPSLCT
jgi:hypothetical protein